MLQIRPIGIFLLIIFSAKVTQAQNEYAISAACLKKFTEAYPDAKKSTDSRVLYYLVKEAEACQAAHYNLNFGLTLADMYLERKFPNKALEELSKAVQYQERWVFTCQQNAHEEGPEDNERLERARIEFAELIARRADMLLNNLPYPRLAMNEYRRAMEFDPSNKTYAVKMAEAESAWKKGGY